MRELEAIERLKRIASGDEARGLLDDVALLGDLVITHDSIAEARGASSRPAARSGRGRR